MKIIFLQILIFASSIHGHGFDSTTKVSCVDGPKSIGQIYNTLHKQKTRVSSFDATFDQVQVSDIAHVGISKSNCFVRISFDANAGNDILCTPSQKFFSVDQQCFIPVCQLKVGDQLLSLYKGPVAIGSIKLIKKRLKVYSLEVQHDHTYFVMGLYF